MKTHNFLFLLLVLAPGLSRIRAASPPNDLYANRIVLTGNSLCFTSSVVGATREMAEVIDPEYVFSGSIWWSWTAQESLPVTVTVERLNLIPGPLDTTTRDAFIVWLPPSSGTSFPTNYCCSSYAIGELPLRNLNPIASMTFTSTPGATYQFEHTGISTNDFKVSIIATNLPLILEQPKSGTVATGRSALLWVLVAGGGPFGYQWRFNETNLPGENGVMLAMTNVTLDRAGNYSVIVSNFGGTVLSDIASLIVNDGVASSRLLVSGQTVTNRFEFQLQGEPGNHYRIESSPNLLEWQPEKSFKDSKPFYSRYFTTSLVFASDTLSTVSVPGVEPRKYFRAMRYAPSNEVCNLNLKELRLAKDLWARTSKRASTDTPLPTDLMPYLPHHAVPDCPNAAYYIFHAVQSPPECVYPGHVLEEPW